VSGKIISIVNRKGGVGKTTVALALADTLVATEQATDATKAIVAVDLDPQASLSHALLLKPNTPPELLTHPAGENTLARAVQDRITSNRRPVGEYITRGVGPTGLSYALVANESTTWDVERRGFRKIGESRLQALLREILDELSHCYRYVLVDCPPGQTVLAEAAIRRSDLVLCPTVPDWLSYWGLSSLDEYLQELFEHSAHKPPARFVLTKFKRKPTKRDPQDRITQLMRGFNPRERYITLLLETGEHTELGTWPITFPHDTKIAERLLGSPNPRRLWPWERIYSTDTKDALRRLTSAIKKELTDGRSTGANAGNGAADQTERHASGIDPQDARQGDGGIGAYPPVGVRSSALSDEARRT
jgi:cellulose biosynthesis protein BcsQ